MPEREEGAPPQLRRGVCCSGFSESWLELGFTESPGCSPGETENPPTTKSDTVALGGTWGIGRSASRFWQFSPRLWWPLYPVFPPKHPRGAAVIPEPSAL